MVIVETTNALIGTVVGTTKITMDVKVRNAFFPYNGKKEVCLYEYANKSSFFMNVDNDLQDYKDAREKCFVTQNNNPPPLTSAFSRITLL